MVEEFSEGYTPEFDDSNREEKIAEGWLLSDDNGRHLRSRHLRDVDMNAAEIVELPSRTAKDLNLYIPCDVWSVDPYTGKVLLAAPWSREDFQAARIAMASF